MRTGFMLAVMLALVGIFAASARRSAVVTTLPTTQAPPAREAAVAAPVAEPALLHLRRRLLELRVQRLFELRVQRLLHLRVRRVLSDGRLLRRPTTPRPTAGAAAAVAAGSSAANHGVLARTPDGPDDAGGSDAKSRVPVAGPVKSAVLFLPLRASARGSDTADW